MPDYASINFRRVPSKQIQFKPNKFVLTLAKNIKFEKICRFKGKYSAVLYSVSSELRYQSNRPV